ncbi:MAG: WYL domain-containing transcriptional regulator [Fibrobacter sp.]|nr:WYL domain-containing transcriptional regulator [Fibrobacter sp.]
MAQWNLVVALHRILSDSRSYLKPEELCDKIDCSLSTLNRLIKALKEQFGAPIINSRKYGGYKYDLKSEESFELPGMWFKTEELEALICIESIVSSIQKGLLGKTFAAFRKRLEKLLELHSIELAEWDKRFKVVPIAYRKTDNDVFRKIADAVLNRKKVKIFYQKPTEKYPQERVISPQVIIRYKDNWYLDAWCHKSDGLRSFTLNRIHKIEILDQSAIDLNDSDLEKFFSKSYGIFNGPAENIAEILFTGIAAKMVSEEIWHQDQTGEWNGEESYLLKIPYGNSKELVMDILRWGINAEVLNPPQLRVEISDIIEKMIKKYKKV